MEEILRKVNSWVKWVETNAEFVMVMLSLLAAWAVQVTHYPPGGVWRTDNIPVDLAGNSRVAAAADGGFPHRAGYSIFAQNDPAGYRVFAALNVEVVVFSAFCFALLLCEKIHIAVSWLLLPLIWACVSASLVNLLYIYQGLNRAATRFPAAVSAAALLVMHLPLLVSVIIGYSLMLKDLYNFLRLRLRLRHSLITS